MITDLKEAMKQVEQLNPAAQRAFADTIRHIIAQVGSEHNKDFPPAQEALKALEALLDAIAHPVFTDEVEWMRHLDMSEESIARVMAAPIEPEPGEEYEDADA